MYYALGGIECQAKGLNSNMRLIRFADRIQQWNNQYIRIDEYSSGGSGGRTSVSTTWVDCIKRAPTSSVSEYKYRVNQTEALSFSW